MKYPWALPGGKVVCIDASNSPGHSWWGEKPPVEGQQYTIESVSTDPCTGSLCIALVGLPRPRPFEFGFRVTRFRPLTTRTQEQDVALFTHLLTGAPVTA